MKTTSPQDTEIKLFCFFFSLAGCDDLALRNRSFYSRVWDPNACIIDFHWGFKCEGSLEISKDADL